GRIAVERVHVDEILDLLHDRRGATGRLLDQVAAARPKRPLSHPAHVGMQLARDQRFLLGVADELPTADVELVLEAKGEGHWRDPLLELSLVGVYRGDPRALAPREHRHLLAPAQGAAGELAGVAAILAGFPTVRGADDP